MKKQLSVILASMTPIFILFGLTYFVVFQGSTETNNVESVESSEPDIYRDEVSSKKCARYEDCDKRCEVDSQDFADECCFTP